MSLENGSEVVVTAGASSLEIVLPPEEESRVREAAAPDSRVRETVGGVSIDGSRQQSVDVAASLFERAFAGKKFTITYDGQLDVPKAAREASELLDTSAGRSSALGQMVGRLLERLGKE